MKRPVKNEKKFQQKVLFRGFENGKTSFTDLDIVREADRKFVLIGEVKEQNLELPYGQRQTMETLLDNPKLKYSVGVVIWHSTPPNKHIDLEQDGYIREIWLKGKWKVIREELMFKDYYDNVIKKTAIELGINGNKL